MRMGKRPGLSRHDLGVARSSEKVVGVGGKIDSLLVQKVSDLLNKSVLGIVD